MADDKTTELQQIRERLDAVKLYLHIGEKSQKLEELEEVTAAPDFWNNQASAMAISKEFAQLKKQVGDFEESVQLLDDAIVANEFAEEGEEFAGEVDAAIEKLNAKLDELELVTLFSGEFDEGDAVINISPGAGGLEAQDWTGMLYNMYIDYANKKGWDVEVIDAPAGEVIGLDHASFIVKGLYAFGMLKAEQGVHRLVRISPTDEKKRRHTTFASVDVLPIVEDEVEIEVLDSDLRIDVFRSSGPGGQSVNTTDSAVRITHLPTNIVVTCQNEKSQLQNKETAMKILKSRLYELERQKQEEELAALRGEKLDNSFGSQIRNYVLYPYQMVKDLRTGIETGNVNAVLGGDLEEFIVGYLRMRASES